MKDGGNNWWNMLAHCAALTYYDPGFRNESQKIAR
jgi:hypothetical protein